MEKSQSFNQLILHLAYFETVYIRSHYHNRLQQKQKRASHNFFDPSILTYRTRLAIFAVIKSALGVERWKQDLLKIRAIYQQRWLRQNIRTNCFVSRLPKKEGGRSRVFYTKERKWRRPDIENFQKDALSTLFFFLRIILAMKITYIPMYFWHVPRIPLGVTLVECV